MSKLTDRLEQKLEGIAKAKGFEVRYQASGDIELAAPEGKCIDDPETTALVISNDDGISYAEQLRCAISDAEYYDLRDLQDEPRDLEAILDGIAKARGFEVRRFGSSTQCVAPEGFFWTKENYQYRALAYSCDSYVKQLRTAIGDLQNYDLQGRLSDDDN